MTVQEAHYSFKLAIDRIDTMSNPDLNRAEIDWLLYQAELLFIKQRYSELSNPKRRGFESTQKRVDDLASLVVKYPLQPGITPTANSGDSLTVELSDLSYPYLHLVAAFADVEISSDCIKKVPLKFTQHDDYRESLLDPFNSPSLEFIPYNQGYSGDGIVSSLYLYPGDLNVTSVYVEYIRKPTRVFYGGYTYIDGNTYSPTSFETPEHTHEEIIDLAAQLAALNIENPEYIQLKNLKVSISE